MLLSLISVHFCCDLPLNELRIIAKASTSHRGDNMQLHSVLAIYFIPKYSHLQYLFQFVMQYPLMPPAGW